MNVKVYNGATVDATSIAQDRLASLDRPIAAVIHWSALIPAGSVAFLRAVDSRPGAIELEAVSADGAGGMNNARLRSTGTRTMFLIAPYGDLERGVATGTVSGRPLRFITRAARIAGIRAIVTQATALPSEGRAASEARCGRLPVCFTAGHRTELRLAVPSVSEGSLTVHADAVHRDKSNTE